MRRGTLAGVESFVVHIYRRLRSPSLEPVGTVEHVGSGRRSAFSGREQLLQALLSAPPPAPVPFEPPKPGHRE
ncbi:MAG: hypothetical protein ACM3N6_14040, partial [Betaproteobacteria bacterium]